MKTADLIVTGVVAIGLVTAFAARASSLAPLTRAGGNAVSGITGTVERG